MLKIQLLDYILAQRGRVMELDSYIPDVPTALFTNILHEGAHPKFISKVVDVAVDTVVDDDMHNQHLTLTDLDHACRGSFTGVITFQDPVGGFRGTIDGEGDVKIFLENDTALGILTGNSAHGKPIFTDTLHVNENFKPTIDEYTVHNMENSQLGGLLNAFINRNTMVKEDRSFFNYDSLKGEVYITGPDWLSDILNKYLVGRPHATVVGDIFRIETYVTNSTIGYTVVITAQDVIDHVTALTEDMIVEQVVEAADLEYTEEMKAAFGELKN